MEEIVSQVGTEGEVSKGDNMDVAIDVNGGWQNGKESRKRNNLLRMPSRPPISMT